MSNQFNLIMLSATHEAGGNTLHRFFDGHPQCFTFPFESTLATSLSSNLIAGPNHWMPQRYAYPVFEDGITAEQAYHAIADHELKPYLRARHTSKFKDCGLVMDEKKRIERFVEMLDEPIPYSIDTKFDLLGRKDYIKALFRSTFDTWENFARTGRETHYVGYIPPINMDADKFFADFPNGKMVHIIRNPWSGYADTIKRPYPFSLERYCQMWNAINHHSWICEAKYPDRFFVVRYEDLVADPKSELNILMENLGLGPFENTPVPSFNRQPLAQVRPWGTIVHPTEEENCKTAQELSSKQIEAIQTECWFLLNELGYTKSRFGLS